MKSFITFLKESDQKRNPLYTGDMHNDSWRDTGWIFHKKTEPYRSKQHLEISKLKSHQTHLNTKSNHEPLFKKKPDIFVMKSRGEHHIIDGNHRIAAAKERGETHIHATVVDMDSFNKDRNKD